jgi:hypothetical protein
MHYYVILQRTMKIGKLILVTIGGSARFRQRHSMSEARQLDSGQTPYFGLGLG